MRKAYWMSFCSLLSMAACATKPGVAISTDNSAVTQEMFSTVNQLFVAPSDFQLVGGQSSFNPTGLMFGDVTYVAATLHLPDRAKLLSVSCSVYDNGVLPDDPDHRLGVELFAYTPGDAAGQGNVAICGASSFTSTTATGGRQIITIKNTGTGCGGPVSSTIASFRQYEVYLGNQAASGNSLLGCTAAYSL